MQTYKLKTTRYARASHSECLAAMELERAQILCRMKAERLIMEQADAKHAATISRMGGQR